MNTPLGTSRRTPAKREDIAHLELTDHMAGRWGPKQKWEKLDIERINLHHMYNVFKLYRVELVVSPSTFTCNKVTYNF